jgi:uncharacterized protein YkwD
MPEQAPRSRTARRAPRLAAVALAALVSLSACTPQQTEAVSLVNGDRSEAHLVSLVPSPHAMEKAQAWAEHLAATGTLAHSTLREGMPEGWQKLGENVGHGPSIEAVEEGFMRSSGHRANILDPAYNWVGTGYASAADGSVYVVQVFARY